jgi:hypothetical protein
MSRRITLVLTCALVILAHSLAKSVSASKPKHNHSSALSPREELWPGSLGNSDLYGLGIRIGVYVQWSSS